jgi:hypothetical protein
MCLDHHFDKLEDDIQQGVIFEIEPSRQPSSSRLAHAAGAEDRRFTLSLWHLRMGATCADAGSHGALPSIPDKTRMAGGRHEG